MTSNFFSQEVLISEARCRPRRCRDFQFFHGNAEPAVVLVFCNVHKATRGAASGCVFTLVGRSWSGL